jgi:hypothetical protein
MVIASTGSAVRPRAGGSGAFAGCDRIGLTYGRCMDALAVLKAELVAEEVSFVLDLHCGRWNRASYSRLEAAARLSLARTRVSRRVAAGSGRRFLLLNTEVATWRAATKTEWRQDAYYRACFQRIDDLTWWFCTGASPYDDAHAWLPL